MEIISELEDNINDELCDAKKYIDLALKYKTERPALAELYYALSNEEMEHMNKLHKQVVSIIEDYRNKNGQPPAEMLAVYNYVHKKDIEKSKEIKILIGMYKG